MPRNTRKLSELLEVINSQKIEIERYKQLIANIQGLISINAGKYSIEYKNNQIDLLAGTERKPTERTDKRKVVYYEDKKVKPDFRKEQEELERQERKKIAEESEKRQTKSHVDELKEELGKQAEAGEEYPKPSKIKEKRKIPTNINEVLEMERENATQATATESQKKKVNINDLPVEARALIEANKARAKAAEREKHHGKEGDEHYKRLTEKEMKERGEIPIGGNCPHCSEVLEAPVIRGYHKECYEARQARGGGN